LDFINFTLINSELNVSEGIIASGSSLNSLGYLNLRSNLHWERFYRSKLTKFRRMRGRNIKGSLSLKVTLWNNGRITYLHINKRSKLSQPKHITDTKLLQKPSSNWKNFIHIQNPFQNSNAYLILYLWNLLLRFSHPILILWKTPRCSFLNTEALLLRLKYSSPGKKSLSNQNFRPFFSRKGTCEPYSYTSTQGIIFCRCNTDRPSSSMHSWRFFIRVWERSGMKSDLISYSGSWEESKGNGRWSW